MPRDLEEKRPDLEEKRPDLEEMRREPVLEEMRRDPVVVREAVEMLGSRFGAR